MGNNHQGVAPRAQMLCRQPKSVQLLRVTESLGQETTIEVNRLPGADAAKHPGELPFELFAGQHKVPPKNGGFRLRTRCQSTFRKSSRPALIVVIGQKRSRK